MIRGAGLEIDPDAADEELVAKAADALELYVAHLGATFLKSSNLRGMGESMTKLIEPFATQEEERRLPYDEQRGVLAELAAIARQILAEADGVTDVIDVEAE